MNNKRIKTFESYTENSDLIHFLSVLNGLIQEKEIVLSKKLISVLKSIKNPISTFLLKCAKEKTDTKLDYSYIDFDKQETMVSYLKTRWEGDGEEFSSARREKLKIGRLISTLANKMEVKFDDKEIEIFVNKYKNSQQGENQRFELVKGQDIKFFYNEDNYDTTGEKDSTPSASLYASCMRYGDTQEYFTVYCDNPNVSMLCLIENTTNKLRGRAIVWHNATIDGNPVIFMDRIYSYKYSVEDLFKEYAKKNGWCYKSKQSSSENETIYRRKKISNPKLEAEIPSTINWDKVRKPYMDTLDTLVEKIIDGKPKLFLSNKADNENPFIEVWNNIHGGTSNINKESDSIFKKLYRYSNKLKVADFNNIKIVNEDEFKIGKKTYETCYECGGKGTEYNECGSCDGSGQRYCYDCGGDNSIRCDNGCNDGYIECQSCEKGRCNECDGSRKETCNDCESGKFIGEMDCENCGGSGNEGETNCDVCDGSGNVEGEVDCDSCDGTGSIECSTCEGSGKCEDCGGEEDIECSNNCDSGWFYCDYCNGGEIECGDCEGNGNSSSDCDHCDTIGIIPKVVEMVKKPITKK